MSEVKLRDQVLILNYIHILHLNILKHYIDQVSYLSRTYFPTLTLTLTLLRYDLSSFICQVIAKIYNFRFSRSRVYQ